MQPPRIFRSKAPLALLAVLTSIVVLGASTATAESTVARTFEGTTSQDLPLSFTAEGSQGEFAITTMSFNTLMTCEDGQQISAGHGFFGFDIPIENGRFQFDFVIVFFALHWKGQINQTGTAARGTLTDLYPALTVDEQAQLCPTGDLTWTAMSTGGNGGAGRQIDVRTTTIKDGAGNVTTTVSYAGG
jgi:hypothetical protein